MAKTVKPTVPMPLNVRGLVLRCGVYPGRIKVCVVNDE